MALNRLSGAKMCEQANATTIQIKLYLGSNGQVAGDVNGSVVGQAGVFKAVGVHQVSRLLGELHSTRPAGPLALHHEGVVISDKVPNESLRHLC